MATRNNKTKKDQIVEVIREAILSGELEPGEKLQQEELAERFSVSPTPIREALRQLEAEGILNHAPYKGVRVAEASIQDVREIYLIRSVLEALATRLAMPYLNSAIIQRLKALQAEMEAHVARGELVRLRKPNYEFHLQIYKAANLPQLLQIIQVLWTKFPWDTLHVLPGRAAVTMQEHRRLIEAIEDGNAKLASTLMQEHIDNGAAALSDYLQSK